MKRRKLQQHTITLTLFALSVAVLLGAVATLANAETANFSVSLTVQNTAPTITWVNSSFSVDLDAATSKYYQFNFTVTDSNGAADLNDSTATIVVEQGSQLATSTACTPSDNGNQVVYNCSVFLPYYFDATSFSINASVEDNSQNYVENTTETFTINSLTAIALTEASLSYDGNPGDTVLATEGAQRVRNTGNYDFTQLNLTAYDLTGSGSEFVGAEQFTVNTTDQSGTGTALVNATAVTVAGADMTHGQDANETLYLYLNIPATISEDTYSSSSDWVVEAT